MKKIYRKNSFDLMKLNKFIKGIESDVLNLLINRKEGQIRLIPDHFKFKEETTKNYKEQADKNLNEAVDKLKTENPDEIDLNEKSVALEEQYEEDMKKMSEKFKRQFDELTEHSQSLNYLNREINAIEKETGRYELYIGYPFVEGYFKDKTFVKAPLLLFPVRIKKEGDCWYLENIADQNILLNKVFLMAFSKYNGIKLNEFETEFDDINEIELNTFEGLLKYLENNNISIKNQDTFLVEKFNEHTADTPLDYSAGELILKKYLVLGRFPVANNSIYNDYLTLEKQDFENELLDKLLINAEALDSEDNTGDEEPLKEIDINEQNLYFLTGLDFSQEKAVKMANDTDELVIYGPPGTGKSQTIANIISDGLAKGKRILMVSQKRAALDVIYNRISPLSSKVAMIHDAEKDKKLFYEKVTAQLEEVTFADTTKFSETLKAKSERIEENLRILDSLGTLLHKDRDFGLTLQEMYSKSKRITSKDDPRYEDYRNFKSKMPLKGLIYDQITEAVESVLTKGLADTYANYRQCISDNGIVINLKDDLDTIEIEEAREGIEKLYDLYKEDIRLSTVDSPYLEPLLNMYITKRALVSEQDIVELGITLNHQTNKDLLLKLNDGRWWSILYWLNYSKNKKLEEENQRKFKKRETLIKEDLFKLSKSIKKFIDSLNFIKDILIEKEHFNLLTLILKRESLMSYIKRVDSALINYDVFKLLVSGVSRLSKLESDLLRYAYNNSKDRSHYFNILNKTPEFSILMEITNIERSEKSEIDRYKEFSILQGDVNKLMREKQKLMPEFVISNWDNKLYNSLNIHKSKEKELRRQAAKKRALWPLRKYLSEFSEILFDLFPCWLLSPETVSEIMPLTNGLFDLIIFDEASQLFIENAIPAIYRSKAIVIAGDDKQLRPSTTFKVRLEEDAEADDIETAAALEEESLLDLAKVSYDYVHLNVHYRSKFEELINFSNYAFYNGRLEVSPNLLRSDNSQKSIERIKVEGKWIDRTNQIEAQKVVELIDDILKNRKENETVGIITFNVNQKDLIDDMLDYKASEDVEFKNLYHAELQRVDGNEDMSLFVKNIENVQGDERDIIIFSTAYAKNENGKLLVNFGSLSQDGGENRLNVAVSRAKKKTYIVTSIEPEELNVEDSKNNGPKLFKKYLQYAREVSGGNKTAVDTLLKSLLNSSPTRNISKDLESDFEIEVYEKLKELGYGVDKQVGVSGYRIDLAVYDEKTSRYVLGIECDGAAYHCSKTARERDIHRQRYLESRGWKIIRIWSKDWWNDWEKELQKIHSFLQNEMKP
jgi:superfamily I DNA and/or RNA helicase/very-short-patch-repair endonuclease